MNIPFVSFEKMHNEIKDEVLAKMQEIYEKNWFIQGPEVTAFEQEFAAYCGTKYCVGCGNGLDALFLALKVMKSLCLPTHILQQHWRYHIRGQCQFLWNRKKSILILIRQILKIKLQIEQKR